MPILPLFIFPNLFSSFHTFTFMSMGFINQLKHLSRPFEVISHNPKCFKILLVPLKYYLILHFFIFSNLFSPFLTFTCVDNIHKPCKVLFEVISRNPKCFKILLLSGATDYLKPDVLPSPPNNFNYICRHLLRHYLHPHLILLCFLNTLP